MTVSTETVDQVSRDNDIVAYHKSGMALREISKRVQMSYEQVRSVLHERGIDTTRRAKLLVGRDKFLGVNVSESAKTALKAEADRRGVSVSALTDEAITAMLKSPIKPQPDWRREQEELKLKTALRVMATCLKKEGANYYAACAEATDAARELNQLGVL